ncbi:MAG: DUF2723 domain-containing protein [Chitinophagales bacterium]|nr:DUF2723 domain-containing protein [Chitinophagales bacterium]
MPPFKTINNISGWIVFICATVVYLLTAEPTGSFWDCGEFISCATKLQVAHSPGAPLFIMVAHLFTLLTGNPENKAVMVNYYSGIMSGFTILFLFWTITIFARKIIGKREADLTLPEVIAVIGSGLIGAFAYTFSDSFWFSAVEGEVYASSAFFTALVFWAMLKWEAVADEPYADRWILFIGYMIGLSIGIHLLNLLTIPALVFIYYFKKFKPSTWGMVKALVIGSAILGFVQYGIIPQIPNFSEKFDILFVNSFGLPFNSGTLFFFILLSGLILFGIYYSYRKSNYYLNTAVLTVLLICIGYSSYVMVVIRASANPSINMGSPSDPPALLSYLNREQYGNSPLMYGQVFTAQATDIDRANGEAHYYPDEKSHKYIVLDHKPVIKYADQDKMLFPRVWDNDDPQHIHFYQRWLNLKEGQKPTMGDNLKFFFTYQVGFMYWRYLMWNFAGRQNDLQGNGEINHGNWISGLPFFDNARLGDQTNLPESMKDNKGRNKFFMLPFILGLIGAIYQFNKNKNDGWVVLLLFFFTGLAIVIYLNQVPLQPRERDYSYAGSTYAYAVWIGLGVLAIYNYLQKKISARNAALTATLVCAIVPFVMGEQGWDDHDRSHLYTARDFGRNYLESCAPNAILFTQGDNDTYPLWYAQEVEGIRNDIRIVNLSLLGVDWYIDNLRRKVNHSDPVIISVDSASYRGSTRDYMRFYDNKAINQNQYYSLSSVLDFMFSSDKKNMLDYGDMTINYLPAKNLYIPVNKQEMVADKVVQLSDTSNIVSRLEWKLSKSAILKNDLMVLEIIRSNLWKRPIYFAISVDPDSYMGLNDYLQQEGLTYRLVPVKAKNSDAATFGLAGFVQPDLMYNNVMNKFSWGGVDKYNVYLDETVLRMVTNLRTNFLRLSDALMAEGKKDSAIAVLDKCQKVLPERNVPISYINVAIARDYYDLGEKEKGQVMAKRLLDTYTDNLKYFASLDPDSKQAYTRDMNEGVAAINQVAEMAQSHGDSTLSKQAQETFQKYVSLYTQPNQ